MAIGTTEAASPQHLTGSIRDQFIGDVKGGERWESQESLVGHQLEEAKERGVFLVELPKLCQGLCRQEQRVVGQ